MPARAAPGSVALRGGPAMPLVGLGTWQMTGRQCYRAVRYALDIGYRLIDTSEEYGNEREVGEAIRKSRVPRDDIFLTTKFNVEWHGRQLVKHAYNEALQRLVTDYVDLFLIHWPNPWLDRYVEAWEGMLDLRHSGRVRAIGVSNFLPAHIDRLLAATGEAPAVNQVELDPTLPQTHLRAYHARHGIATEAWGPLGRDGRLFHEPVIIEIAQRHSVAPAQVILRWHIEQGNAFTARSSSPERLAQNIDLFGFSLRADELEQLASLDAGRTPARDPETHGH
jgi:2,5-diketo-D-gluconate reductase A